MRTVVVVRLNGALESTPYPPPIATFYKFVGWVFNPPPHNVSPTTHLNQTHHNLPTIHTPIAHAMHGQRPDLPHGEGATHPPRGPNAAFQL